jgi:ubiquinone/menaquinone biosynthesis C-methylase UbiE
MSAPQASSRIESYNQYGATFVDRLRTRLVLGSVRRKIPLASDLKALDLGCGYHARFLMGIQDRLAHGTGVDFAVSPECTQNPKMTFVLSSIEAALPHLPDQNFDLVLLISVLEHVWRPLGCLEHCYRVLKPGGLLLVNVPTWMGKPVLEFSAFKLGTSPACEMDDHKMYYNKRDLWPLLVAAGFKPSRLKLRYEKFGMTLFVTARREVNRCA